MTCRAKIDKAKLTTGWVSASLVKSETYRDALRDRNDGDAASAEAAIEAALDGGTLWSAYGFGSAPDRISLYSTADPYFTSSVTSCSDVYAAQCMGAPCWDTTCATTATARATTATPRARSRG